MDLSWLERTELIIGRESLEKLANSKVLIVGLGGVGSFAAEFIARAGIGELTIIDGDIVDVTNKNRQLPALTSTIGMKKADLMAARIKDINPDVSLTVIDASSVMVSDIKDTYNDPFARLVRKRLHKYGIYTGFKSVFNTELVHRDSVKLTDGSNFKRSFYGTISYMPALFGLRMAAEVIEDLR